MILDAGWFRVLAMVLRVEAFYAEIRAEGVVAVSRRERVCSSAHGRVPVLK